LIQRKSTGRSSASLPPWFQNIGISWHFHTR
jgi:hypothetical protein